MFKKIYWILDKIRSVAIIGMLGYIVILSFVQIVLRYFTSADLKPFSWGDEIIRLMAIWVAFLATAVVIAALAAVTYAGAMHVMKNTTNMLQNLPDITIAWFYAAVPVGGFYLILEYAVQLFGWKDGAEEEVGK